MAKVSVIVPVYNVRDYVTACVESLRRQTLQDIEVLLVDDGSTDGSGELCDDLAAIDPRFKVIHEENGGLSIARNTGIANANSEYLMFVDSDDYVSEDFCKIPYETLLKEQADFGLFGFFRFSDTKKPYKLPGRIPTGNISHHEALALLARDHVGNYAWNKIVKKSLFKNVEYPRHRYFEDVATTYKLVDAAQRIVGIDDALYFYRDRPGSILNKKTRRRQEDLCRDSFTFFSDFYGHLKDENIPLSLDDDYRHIVWPALGYCLYHADQYETPLYQEAFNFLRHTGVPKLIPIRYKIFMVIAHVSFPLFKIGCMVFSKVKRID